MGEAADDILEGLACQHCGEWMHDIIDGAEAPGYPRSCPRCKRQDQDFHPQPAPEKVSCSICQRRVKAAGLYDHMRAKHGAPADSKEPRP